MQRAMLRVGCSVPRAPHFRDRPRHVNHREVKWVLLSHNTKKLLFVKLVCLSNEPPGPFHRAVQRHLVRDDRIRLTSYALVVGSHAEDSTTKEYFVPYSCGRLPQPWNTLHFPTVPGE